MALDFALIYSSACVVASGNVSERQVLLLRFAQLFTSHYLAVGYFREPPYIYVRTDNLAQPVIGFHQAFPEGAKGDPGVQGLSRTKSCQRRNHLEKRRYLARSG